MILFPVVILAGGLATRLRPQTDTMPKSLIRINDVPFIIHQLHALQSKGIREVVICTGYLGEMIEAVVGNGKEFGLSVCYSQDGAELLGTGGAIKKALPMLSDIFFVLYGDSYLLCDYAVVQAAFLQQKKMGLMTVYKNEMRAYTNNIEYRDNEIIAYDKIKTTAQMQYIDYGIGILNQAVFADFPQTTTFDLTDVYRSLLQNHQLAALEVMHRFYEIGSFAGIQELAYYFSQHLQVSNQSKEAICNS